MEGPRLRGMLKTFREDEKSGIVVSIAKSGRSATFGATLNYIHHNPVHHGLVEKWQDWIWSSAVDFVESVGRERAAQIWKEHPILDYGKGWDN
jgi:putative transposase